MKGLTLALCTFLLTGCATTTYHVIDYKTCPAPLTMSACAERMGLR